MLKAHTEIRLSFGTGREFLVKNLGEAPVDMMRAIKRALDPKGILNPGKIFALDG